MCAQAPHSRNSFILLGITVLTRASGTAGSGVDVTSCTGALSRTATFRYRAMWSVPTNRQVVPACTCCSFARKYARKKKRVHKNLHVYTHLSVRLRNERGSLYNGMPRPQQLETLSGNPPGLVIASPLDTQSNLAFRKTYLMKLQVPCPPCLHQQSLRRKVRHQMMRRPVHQAVLCREVSAVTRALLSCRIYMR